jgi:putative ABC transport system substrate-binding protein
VFDKFVESRVSAVMVVGDAVFFSQRKFIVERAAANRLPGMYPEREYAEAGGVNSWRPGAT